MKVVLLADLHAHTWADFCTIVPYRSQKLNSRLVDALRVLDDVRRYARENSVELVIVAGDLFHRRRLIDVAVFNAVAAALHRLTRVAEVWLLVGNHDQACRSWGGVFSGEHALSALGCYRRVRIFDRPTVCDGVGLVPYADDRQTLLKGLDKVQKARLLVMHAGVAGAKTGALEMQPFEPIAVGDLPKLPIYSGHYHWPHQLYQRNQAIPDVVYAGSPMELARNDGHAAWRGFCVVDPEHPRRWGRVSLKTPGFYAVGSDGLEKALESLVGHFVDLRLARRKDSPAKLERKLLKAGVRAVNVLPYVEPTKERLRLRVKRETGLPSLAALCKAYVKIAPVALDRKRLQRILKRLLAETA
jgi:DNA repair exonuclease SbcCD nuclease subunit